VGKGTPAGTKYGFFVILGMVSKSDLSDGQFYQYGRVAPDAAIPPPSTGGLVRPGPAARWHAAYSRYNDSEAARPIVLVMKC
jgi:hypothetical protein